MRIALVADAAAADTALAGTERVSGAASNAPVSNAAQQRAVAGALRDAGQQVTEHVMDGGPDVRAAVPAFTAALQAAWSRQRPDVVHAVGWAGALAALAAARDAGLPVVTAFGSLAMTERRHGLAPPLDRARLERAIGLSSSAVIAASAEEADDLVRMGVSRRRVQLIPAAVDTARFSPEGPASPRAVGPRAARPRVVGVTSPDDEQCAVLARALGAVPGAELAPCPDGDAELAALLRSADVFVHVPGYVPRGTRCLRAMACGVPVIVSAVGAHLDMVVDGTTGMLVPTGRPDLLAARIRHLLAHPILRLACGVAAADRARSRYSLDRVAGELLAAYDTVVPAQAAAA